MNVSGSKNFNTSSYERIEMLKTALADLAGKIDFRPVLQEAKQDLISQISQGHKTITMIGGDSYLALPDGALDDLSRQWLVFRRIGTSAPVNSVKENVQFREVPGIEGEVSSSLARGHNLTQQMMIHGYNLLRETNQPVDVVYATTRTVSKAPQKLTPGLG